MLATGGYPKQLDVPFPDERVTTYRTASDFSVLDAIVRDPEIGHVTVIGGGLLGTELADGISRRGL